MRTLYSMASRWRPTRGGSGVALVAALLVLTACANAARTAPTPVPIGQPMATAPNPDVSGPPVDVAPDAKTGDAWCRVWVPPVYATVMDRVCVKPARSRTIRIPAKYGTRPKLVCVKEPELTETIVGAVWGTKKHSVLVCPPKEEVRRIDCPPSKDLAQGETQGGCWTKVERPGVWREEECPVYLSPERQCVTYTPAQYRVEEERFLLEDARTETVCEPAVFENRFRQVCQQPGRWEWRRNTECEVPQEPAPPDLEVEPEPAPLPALQVEMQDLAATGEEAGTFAVGDVVRYDLVVSSDEGAVPMKGLVVVFTLPPELEFVEGRGDGLTIEGDAGAAKSTPFDLEVGTQRTLELLCRVKSVPPDNLVQLTASIRDADGNELAEETESTTLKPKP